MNSKLFSLQQLQALTVCFHPFKYAPSLFTFPLAEAVE
jgi:hypothetical protein